MKQSHSGVIQKEFADYFVHACDEMGNALDHMTCQELSKPEQAVPDQVSKVHQISIDSIGQSSSVLD